MSIILAYKNKIIFENKWKKLYIIFYKLLIYHIIIKNII